MAKLDTYVELLTSTLGALSNTSTGAASFSIVSAALEVNTGTGSDQGKGGLELAYGGDIDESSIYFEVTAIPTGGRCDITCDDVTESGYRVRLDTTNITVARLAAGTPTTIAGPTAWSSASHKWLRFREASGTFATLASEATTTSGMDHTAVRLFWFAPNLAGTGVTRFRYLNTSAPVPVYAVAWLRA